MKAFYMQYYFSRKMSAALIGPQSISDLIQLGESSFRDIPHLPLPRPSSSWTNPFPITGLTVRILPVKELCELSIVWAIPPTRSPLSLSLSLPH
jgi:secreted Zn-dependent insulinase-like peptidase